MSNTRRVKFASLFVALVAVGYGTVRFIQGSSAIPQSFTDARTQGAVIAQNIVNLSNQSTATLEQVNKLDQQQNYEQALTLTTGLVTQSQQIRDQAVQLSAQIENMTRSLSNIADINAQQAALESITNRLALINQLINYSGDLGQLLQVLQNRFAGKGGDTNAQVTTLVNQINTDVNAINNFNSQAGQAMDRFDTIVGK